MFDDIIKLMKDYTNDFSTPGIITLILDLVLVIAVVVFFYSIIKKKIKSLRLLTIGGIYLLLFIIVVIFDLKMLKRLLEILGFWSVGLFLIIYSQEIKHMLDSFLTVSKVNNVYSSKEDKQIIIKCILSTVDYLSKRNIGALITFEREDSLNSIIDKSISIDANITQEILTTIFTPGTACHDGAVIIRKNKIMCAGAYFPSTDKYDVPKFLGTRHRAAIGLSERYDALTIVVSEETGNVSVTISGVIDLELSMERLEELLDRYLMNK